MLKKWLMMNDYLKVTPNCRRVIDSDHNASPRSQTAYSLFCLAVDTTCLFGIPSGSQLYCMLYACT